MITTSNLNVLDDNIEEEYIRKNRKVKRKNVVKNNTAKIKLSDTKHNGLTKKILRRLNKKLKKSEGKNFNNAITIIAKNDLYQSKPVVRTSLPEICLKCEHSVKLFGYCDKYNTKIKNVKMFTNLTHNYCPIKSNKIKR